MVQHTFPLNVHLKKLDLKQLIHFAKWSFDQDVLNFLRNEIILMSTKIPAYFISFVTNFEIQI